MASSYDNYFKPVQTVQSARMRMVELYVRMPYLAKICCIVRRLPANARFLEIGSGEGFYLEIFRRLRPDIEFHAVDLHNCLIFDQLRQLPFHTCDLNRDVLPYTDGFFDFANSMQVIEHITNLDNYMREICRVLKPGGRVHIEAPDVRMALLPHIPLLSSDRGGMNFWDDPTHIRPYSRQSLRRLAEMYDLHVLDTFYARKWAHMTALPLALITRDNNYWAAFLQTILGLFCAVHAEKPCNRESRA